MMYPFFAGAILMDGLARKDQNSDYQQISAMIPVEVGGTPYLYALGTYHNARKLAFGSQRFFQLGPEHETTDLDGDTKRYATIANGRGTLLDLRVRVDYSTRSPEAQPPEHLLSLLSRPVIWREEGDRYAIAHMSRELTGNKYGSAMVDAAKASVQVGRGSFLGKLPGFDGTVEHDAVSVTFGSTRVDQAQHVRLSDL
jgi:hypothetical protein